MYSIRATAAVVTLLVAAWASIDIRRSGWLDRMVQYKKELFIQDVNKMAPVKIKATVIPTPRGYKDSNRWDFNSVVHLLILLKHSENAAPVQRVLRRAFKPSRRLMMSMADSFKHFPSLAKETLNEFYYDAGSAEDYEEEENKAELEAGVIVVTNPVEARLPSTQISIKLLKDILLARAIAARESQTTLKSTIPWIPMNKTYSYPADDNAGGDAGGATTVAAGTGADATDGGGGEEGGEGGEATTAAAEGAEPEPDGETNPEGDPEGGAK